MNVEENNLYEIYKGLNILSKNLIYIPKKLIKYI